MSPDPALVRVDVDGPVAIVTLNRPQVLNCLDEPMLEQIDDAFAALASVDALRVVIVRGAGRAFCSGIDLTALAHGRIPQGFYSAWERTLRRIETFDCVVVCAIHSHCIGGGLQLALACDLRVARDDARLGITAIHEGILPGMGMWRIARHAGAGRAKRLALAADVIDAHTAAAWGLVDYVATEAEFDERVRELTERLIDASRTSARLSKKLINMAFDVSHAECLEVFASFQQQAVESPEHRRAMQARRAARRS